MPTAKKAYEYEVVKGFAYPADGDVRRRIAEGDHMPQEERGEITRHAVGDRIMKSDLPLVVFTACVRRGAVKVLLAKELAAKPEEVPDGA